MKNFSRLTFIILSVHLKDKLMSFELDYFFSFPFF